MNNLSDHLSVFPDSSQIILEEICSVYAFNLLIKKARQTKLGDFRYPIKNEIPKISVNEDSNSYRVLITFLHELAHLIVYLEEGRSRNPHGAKWKKRFSQLLHIFNEKDVFPSPLFEAVGRHLQNPKASSHADVHLLNALRHFDTEKHELILIDIAESDIFKLKNGKAFAKGNKRRTRFLCTEIASGKKYLIHGHAEVFPIE